MSEASVGDAVREVAASEMDAWDALVRSSLQGTLFHSALWLDSGGFPRTLYGYFRGGELCAGCAVGRPATRAAGHPTLTPYLGLLLPVAEQKYVTTMSANKSIASLFAARLQRDFDSVALRFPPEISDLQPFQWAGFAAGVRYTYRLRLSRLDTMLSDMDAKRRNDIRRAERDGVSVDEAAPFSQVWSMCEKSLVRQGVKDGLQAVAVRVERALRDADRCRGFLARGSNGSALAAAWIVWDHRRAYYLLGGHDDAANSGSAATLALWKAISFATVRLGLAEFDFEGSMLPTVEQFFRKFGGTLLPTYTVHWARPRSLGRRIAGRMQRLVSRAFE